MAQPEEPNDCYWCQKVYFAHHENLLKIPTQPWMQSENTDIKVFGGGAGFQAYYLLINNFPKRILANDLSLIEFKQINPSNFNLLA